MTYDEAIRFLFSLQQFGLKPGLERTRELARRAGNPQIGLRFLHVAGTNGKGSTCAMLESIHRAAGRRVGLYSSPHLVRFAERIQVNRAALTDTEVAGLVAELRPLAHGLETTFFEFVTVMALRHFARQRCDLVVWETGLGGRWDATNIVDPLVSVITNVGWDHQAVLGDTLAKIAAEKAGILKPGVPAVTAATEPEALGVIEEFARQQRSPLTVVREPERWLAPLNPRLALPGAHQRVNAAVAVAAAEATASHLPVSPAALRLGLEAVTWPGRFQVIRRGRQTLVLDGAHNTPGIEALVATLHAEFPNRRPALLLGTLADKDWPRMCALLAPVASRVVVAPVQSQRTASPEQLHTACAAANPSARVKTADSLATAWASVADEDFVVLTGSLYLVGEALELLGPPAAGGSERSLNEWSGRATVSPIADSR